MGYLKMWDAPFKNGSIPPNGRRLVTLHVPIKMLLHDLPTIVIDVCIDESIKTRHGHHAQRGVRAHEDFGRLYVLRRSARRSK